MLLTFFSAKNTCELDIVLTRIVNILTTNELVKLKTLWTTGPRNGIMIRFALQRLKETIIFKEQSVI